MRAEHCSFSRGQKLWKECVSPGTDKYKTSKSSMKENHGPWAVKVQSCSVQMCRDARDVQAHMAQSIPRCTHVHVGALRNAYTSAR